MSTAESSSDGAHLGRTAGQQSATANDPSAGEGRTGEAEATDAVDQSEWPTKPALPHSMSQHNTECRAPKKPAVRSMSGSDAPLGLFGSKKSITWDESTIALHDQDRGTRMKIDEPNTPFHRADSGQASDEDADEGESVESGRTPSSCPVCSAAGPPNPQQQTCICPHELIDRLTRLSEKRGKNSSEATVESLEGTVDDREIRNREGGRSPRNSNDIARSNDSFATNRSYSSGCDSGDDSASQRRAMFEMKRKAHYNEFQVLKQLRDSGSFPLDDDDETANDTGS